MPTRPPAWPSTAGRGGRRRDCPYPRRYRDGENGELWGGECLRVNYRECEHLGGLPAVALPGGDLAARQPWRNLLAHCLAFVPEWQNYADTAALRQQSWPLLARAIERGINAPQASSCGRLFDAVACALGCAPLTLSYEGKRRAVWRRWRRPAKAWIIR